MADAKISALPASTTPLAGTEVLPIVQSSATVKVSVANLTAGRSVSMTKLTASIPSGTDYHEMLADGLLNWGANGYLVTSFNAKTVAGSPGMYIGYNSSTKAGIIGPGAVGGAPNQGMEVWAFDNVSAFQQVGTFSAVAAKAGLTLNIGNFVPPATKGIDYSANTPAAGMTSQLLNWYEEGTWTPTQGGGLTVVGAFSSTGRYTRIGRQVTVSGTVTGATSVAVTAAGIVTTNLPFTVVTAGHGNATDAAVNASAAVICTTTNVTSANAIAATGTITFSATYFV